MRSLYVHLILLSIYKLCQCLITKLSVNHRLVSAYKTESSIHIMIIEIVACYLQSCSSNFYDSHNFSLKVNFYDKVFMNLVNC